MILYNMDVLPNSRAIKAQSYRLSGERKVLHIKRNLSECPPFKGYTYGNHRLRKVSNLVELFPSSP